MLFYADTRSSAKPQVQSGGNSDVADHLPNSGGIRGDGNDTDSGDAQAQSGSPPAEPDNSGDASTSPSHARAPEPKIGSNIAASPAEVFAVIQKMFLDPPPTPAPIGVEYMPAGTEILRNKLEEDYIAYSPLMWADPLIPTSVSVDTDEQTIDWLPSIDVDVNNDAMMTFPGLSLSALGVRTKAIVDAILSQTSAIWQLIPISALKNLSSIATIMQMSNIESGPLLDEAALTRLLMLQTMTVSPVQQVYVSTAVNEESINTYVSRKDSKIVWTPALESSDNLQIGTATETSTLYFRTIDEYAELLSGDAADDIAIKTKSGDIVDPSNVVFIPVKSRWRGQAWLMPYIISFTTTAWWNHAMVIKVEYTNTVDPKTEGRTMKMSFMPKAATVYIPGKYSRVCLVVVDSTRSIYPESENYEITMGIYASRTGQYEFAKQVYISLGRMTDTSVTKMVDTDIVEALNHMIEFLCTRAEFRSIQMKAAVLATSRMNGFGAYPKPDEPPKQKATAQRNHLFGPGQFNSKENIKIADYKLPDIAEMASTDRLKRLKAFQSWRTDPLGYMAYGQVNCKKDTAHYPAMWKHTATCIQYQLAESTANMRILRACGVFAQDSESDKHTLQKPVDVYNTTLGYASLTLGLTNWAAMELGVTIFEHNIIGKSWTCLPNDYVDLWPLLTNGFVVKKFDYVDRLVDKPIWRNLGGWMMNQWSDDLEATEDWIEVHYSWNTPWCNVPPIAIAEKFGHKFVCSTPAKSDLILDGDDSDTNNMVGWLIEAGHSA